VCCAFGDILECRPIRNFLDETLPKYYLFCGVLMSYIYIAFTIIFTVYGQIVIKWQASNAGPLPEDFNDKLLFLLRLVFNPWVLSGLAAAFLASLAWMAAMTKLDLSHAYPFMSLAFVLVLFLSVFFFNEPLTWPKIAGMALIVGGILVGSQG
jgi:multidrug transporter EmrE-like cation transporter